VLCDYRDQLISERTRTIKRLRWHLVTIAPELEAQTGVAAMKGPRICARLSRQLARLTPSPQLRVARRQLRRITEIGRGERDLLADLTTLLDAHAPQLLVQPGCGTVTAAIIIGHTAGAARFPTDGHFARHAATVPVPASSGNTVRHRLHRGGDRQLTARSTSSRSPAPAPNPRPASTSTASTKNQGGSHPSPEASPRPAHLAAALHDHHHGRPARADQSQIPASCNNHLT
jgi:transposase